MVKINWHVSGSNSAVEFDVVSNTRQGAIAQAESMWLDLNSWQNDAVIELEGFTKSPIPEFKAVKENRKFL